ncbi:MAG: acyl-ACP--UDP-N-acetylglucosamine O-acyltransferase [Chthoniobacteraceae bacterium]|nr:acyl-ACP--UDP-N-acetylglucosamine O-acyltransferase [Chthoniobacteraceae bacterium]
MPATQIHPTAIVDPAAQLGEGVFVGPYCIIGPGVTLGDGCWLQHHVTICGPARIGRGNKFFAYGSIGQQTQDLKYKGEPTYLEIGDDNSFREFVSVHRATFPGDATRIGNRGNFLAYAHVAHDCVVGDEVIFSNNGTLGGHVQVGDHVIVGGLSAVHQFCRIGRYAMIGGCTKIVQDVPPFMIADGNPAEIRGINKVGMERHGFSAETVREIKESYRILYRMNLNTKGAIVAIGEKLQPVPEICQLLDFLKTSERGIVR